MQPGCTLIGVIYGKPEHRATLTAILAAQVETTRRESGCLEYQFHVSQDDHDKFMFYENWTSPAALDEHLQQPHLQPLFSRKDELMARDVELIRLTMLSEYAR